MKQKWLDGTPDDKRIILFLVSRGFRSNYNKSFRVEHIEHMLRLGRTRDRMLQVLAVDGDKDVSENKYKHYVASCLSIRRYFQQEGAKEFLDDMTTVDYYLRHQPYGSCFLQASCVLISYLVQAYGKRMPPPDGSQLIRHNFTDDQLYSYIVADTGGDSVAIFRLLEKQFFDCNVSQRPFCVIPSSVSCTRKIKIR